VYIYIRPEAFLQNNNEGDYYTTMSGIYYYYYYFNFFTMKTMNRIYMYNENQNIPFVHTRLIIIIY